MHGFLSMTLRRDQHGRPASIPIYGKDVEVFLYYIS
jgi:hypothetical protein